MINPRAFPPFPKKIFWWYFFLLFLAYVIYEQFYCYELVTGSYSQNNAKLQVQYFSVFAYRGKKNMSNATTSNSADNFMIPWLII